MYPDLRSIPLCNPDTIQTIYKCCNFNYPSKQSQWESKKPDCDHLKVPSLLRLYVIQTVIKQFTSFVILIIRGGPLVEKKNTALVI